MTIPAVPAWIMCRMRPVAPDRGTVAISGNAGWRAAAAATGSNPRTDDMGYADGVSRERHAGTWRGDLRKTHRRIQRRQAADQAELRCRGRHPLGGHACRDRGRSGAGRRCARGRTGSRGRDLRVAHAAVSGEIECRCQAACRYRTAAPRGGLAEAGPAAALSDALAAFRNLVEDAAAVAVRSRWPFDSHL